MRDSSAEWLAVDVPHDALSGLGVCPDAFESVSIRCHHGSVARSSRDCSITCDDHRDTGGIKALDSLGNRLLGSRGNNHVCRVTDIKRSIFIRVESDYTSDSMVSQRDDSVRVLCM